MPLSFDDHELDLLMSLAMPIDPDLRDDFLRAVAAELGCLPEQQRGDGALYRVARDAQRKFLTPLSSHSAAFHSKYSR
jgi:hypothetical protein